MKHQIIAERKILTLDPFPALRLWCALSSARLSALPRCISAEDSGRYSA